MRINLLFIVLVLFLGGVSIVPALAQDVGHKCVANCDTPNPNTPQQLDCQRGTHQEGNVCVPNVPGQAVPNKIITPQDKKPHAKSTNNTNPHWWTDAISKGRTLFRNDIFNPIWWGTISSKFRNDIFNKHFWWIDKPAQFFHDIFNPRPPSPAPPIT